MDGKVVRGSKSEREIEAVVDQREDGEGVRDGANTGSGEVKDKVEG